MGVVVNFNNRKLNNGATVIGQLGDVVIAQWGKEFVTWRIDNEGNAYCGHYFRNEDEAKQDFLRRV